MFLNTANGGNLCWTSELLGALTQGTTMSLLLPSSNSSWLSRERRQRALRDGELLIPHLAGDYQIKIDNCFDALTDLSSEPDMDEE